MGDAAWQLLIANNRLGERAEDFKKLWQQKITPYDIDKHNASNKRSQGSTKIKGRWYQKFAGEVEPNKIDPNAVAQLIEKHLYTHAQCLGNNCKGKSLGLIANRAQSIANNVLRPATEHTRQTCIDETTKSQYEENGDLAEIIYKEIETLLKARQGKPDCSPAELRKKIAPHLCKRYGLLFRHDDGTVMTVKAAMQKKEGYLNCTVAFVNTICAT